jgi:cell division septation protein DedD
MTDEREDGKTSKRIEPEIRINDGDADNELNSSDALYNGDLFDRSGENKTSESSIDDDFELNKFSYEPASNESLTDHQTAANDMSDLQKPDESEFPGKQPIIPNEGATYIPPAAGTAPTSSLMKQYKNKPLAITLAAVVILLSVYAMWSGSDQSEKVAVIEENPLLQIEDTGKLQNQEIETLRKQISELEKKQRLLADQKTSLESQLQKQANKHKADMTALKQKQLAETKAIKDEFNGKLADIRAAKQKPKSTITASNSKPSAQPTAATPATKKKPVIRKPKINLTDLPGPIESVADMNITVSPASTNRVKSWGVNLMSLGSEAAAKKEIQRLQGKGIQAESLQVSSGGKNMYRIRVAGFASKQEALDMQTLLAREHGLKDTWINNQ